MDQQFFEDFESQFERKPPFDEAHVVLDCKTQMVDDGSFDAEVRSMTLVEEAEQLLADLKAANERSA